MHRIVLRVAIIALVSAAVAVLTVLKYTTNDDGLRTPVVTVRIPTSGIDGLSAEQVCTAQRHADKIASLASIWAAQKHHSA